MMGAFGRKRNSAIVVLLSALLLISADSVLGSRHQWSKDHGILGGGEHCRLPNNVVVGEDGKPIDLEKGVRVHLTSDGCNIHSHEWVRRREETEKNHGITGALTSFFTRARDSVASLWGAKKAREVDSKNHHCIIKSFFREAREWIATKLWVDWKNGHSVDSESKDGPVFKLRRSIESWKHPQRISPSITSDTEAGEFPTSLDHRAELVVPPKFNTIVAEVVEEYHARVLSSPSIDSCVGVVEEELRILFKNLKLKLMEQCNSGDGSASLLDQKFCGFFNHHPNMAAHMMFAKNGISPFEEASMQINHIASCASSVRHWRHGLSQVQQLVPLVHFAEHKLEQHHREYFGEYPHEHERPKFKEHEHERPEFKQHEHKHMRWFGWRQHNREDVREYPHEHERPEFKEREHEHMRRFGWRQHHKEDIGEYTNEHERPEFKEHKHEHMRLFGWSRHHREGLGEYPHEHERPEFKEHEHEHLEFKEQEHEHTRRFGWRQHHREDLGEYAHEHEHSEFKEHESEHMRRFGWRRLKAVLFPMLKNPFRVHKNWALHNHYEFNHDTVALEEVPCQVCFIRNIHHIAASFHHSVHSMCESPVSRNTLFACNFIHEHKFLAYNTFIEIIRPWEFATSECARTCATPPNEVFLFGIQRPSMGSSVFRFVQENGSEPRFEDESSMVGKSKTDLVERGSGRSPWKIHNGELLHAFPSVSPNEVRRRHSSNDPHVKKLGRMRTILRGPPLRRSTVHIWKSEGGSGNEVNAWTQVVIFNGQPYSSEYLLDPFLHDVKLTGLFKTGDPVILRNDIMLKPVHQYFKKLELEEVLEPNRQFALDLLPAVEGRHLDTLSDTMDGQKLEQSERTTDDENGDENAVDMEDVKYEDPVDAEDVVKHEDSVDVEGVVKHEDSVDVEDVVKHKDSIDAEDAVKHEDLADVEDVAKHGDSVATEDVVKHQDSVALEDVVKHEDSVDAEDVVKHEDSVDAEEDVEHEDSVDASDVVKQINLDSSFEMLDLQSDKETGGTAVL